jgi:diaminohydroxyphosphoribosylaminopyrimidine deaminase/5-amino-6-(5-phosphoribosylamino)uracil reductase
MKYDYMRKAIELSKLGIGHVNPNPLVGAIIVKNNNIIGKGYHKKYGGPHAEINAFNSVTEDVTGAQMYVTLEPCSHYGKTPPCVDKIIDNKISKVYIGMKDPNPLVAGNGIQKLIDNGIEVEVGILEDEIKKLNEIFIKYITTEKPFCIMKTGMSLDGKIGTYSKDSKWITNEHSREYVHYIRNRVAGIMVGIGTIIEDNPSLTTRLEGINTTDPIRIIVDTNGRTPINANIFNNNSNAKTIIATTNKANKDKLNQLKDKAEIIITPEKDNKVDLSYLIKKLGEQKIDSILIEGGGTLNWSALNENIVDKVITFIAPKIIGGKEAITPIEGKGVNKVKDSIRVTNINIDRFYDDIMVEGYIDKGDD